MDELEQWQSWRTEQRKKHRTMTWGEYMAWCRGGDSISRPYEANAFPGGLTIHFNTPPVIGRMD